jgi:hypothetical protein
MGDVVQFVPSHDKKPNGKEGLADAANVICRIRNKQGVYRTLPYEATFSSSCQISTRAGE